ncbi:uncharacterized protein inaF-D isoform X2 [Eurosta solidaginis]|uniref:uncharacterized protein inaF-D isoform X2 n=1 Tax=Eurosta solidaginis TaxID=178769 RepID=UPI00353060A9
MQSSVEVLLTYTRAYCYARSYKRASEVIADKVVIPEKIAIRLLNSSEVTAEQFYKHILEQYRILNQLQQQRQQYLQKQHFHLQQLAAGNKFQEVFATATIIQANPNDPIRKAITPTNGTYLFDPSRPIVDSIEPRIPILDTAQGPIPVLAPASALATSSSSATAMATANAANTNNGHGKRKTHRKHYNNNNYHHRHTSRKNHRKNVPVVENSNLDNNNDYEPEPFVVETPPMNPPILSVVQEPYTQLPIPLVLNSREDKRPVYYTHIDRRGGGGNAAARKRAGYDTQTYMNPLLTGELIFEK